MFAVQTSFCVINLTREKGAYMTYYRHFPFGLILKNPTDLVNLTCQKYVRKIPYGLWNFLHNMYVCTRATSPIYPIWTLYAMTGAWLSWDGVFHERRISVSVMASTEGLSGLPQMSPRTTRMVAVTCPKGFLATTLYKPASDGAAGFKVKIEWPSSVLTMLSLEKERKKVHQYIH